MEAAPTNGIVMPQTSPVGGINRPYLSSQTDYGTLTVVRGAQQREKSNCISRKIRYKE